MKLIAKSTKLATFFTSTNVYSNLLLDFGLNSIVLASAMRKISLSLSKSYTHTANHYRLNSAILYPIANLWKK